MLYFLQKTLPALQGPALIGGRRLQEGGAYFKVREIIHIKFQNLVILSFKTTINNYYYDI